MEKAYHITTRNGSELGPFTETEVREGIRSNRFTANDLAWTVGQAEWLPLHTLLRPPPPPNLSLLPQVSNKSIGKAVDNKSRDTVVGILVLGIAAYVYLQLPDGSSNETPNGPLKHKSTEASQKRVVKPLPTGNQAIKDYEAASDTPGTTVERDEARDAVKRSQRGRTLEFEGTVDDVESDKKITVQLDSGNYANVDFSNSSPQIRDLKKSTFIRFTAMIDEFGTGIFIKHDLTSAVLIP